MLDSGIILYLVESGVPTYLTDAKTKITDPIKAGIKRIGTFGLSITLNKSTIAEQQNLIII